MKMEKKKLLILGANAETAKLVNVAKNKGIYTIVTDNVIGAYAKKYADKSYDINGLDVDNIVLMAKQEGIDGILVGTADPLIPAYYEVAKRMGLPCYVTEKSLKAFTNKKAFKECCAKFDIQGVPEYKLEDIREGKNVVYPILVKPADGRSGKGITVCYSYEEIDAAIQKALNASQSKEVLFERYMECDDVFMYYTFNDGKYYLSAMPDRFTCHEQVGVDPVVLGATYPSKYLDVYLNTLHEKMCRMFEALEIKNGVLLIQAFVENGQFYVYDPGFRLQGGAPHLLLEAINGINHQEMLIDFALTGKMCEEHVMDKNDVHFQNVSAASQVILLKAGKIGKIEGIEEVSKMPGVVATTQRLFEGEIVDGIGTEQQILVRFHLVCATKKELKDLVGVINNTVHAYDESGKEMCLEGLKIE